MPAPTFRFNSAALIAAKNGAVQDTLGKLADDIDSYLGSTLHVWTGEMRDKRFAEVDERGDNPEVVFGSDAPHTIYHELSSTYPAHPQIREAGDLFAAQLGPRLVAAFRARVR